MSDALQLLVSLDQDAIRATAELRCAPATSILTLASAWWVKGPLLVGAGWCADLRSRRVFPLVALAAGRRTRWGSTRSSECRDRRRFRPGTR